MKLLALDTATDLCSAALWIDGRLLWREQLAPREHGRLLLPMVELLLAEAALALRELDAICFGRGPGAFTGLRLAAAVAQGLAFATSRPVIPISDLRALALRALERPDSGSASRVLVCQDARMAEVYWACFERSGNGVRAVGPERVGAPESVVLPAPWEAVSDAAGVVAAGSGFGAYPLRLQRVGVQPGPVLAELLPRAREIAQLAAQDGLAAAVPPEQALPVYLRDQVASVAATAAN